jgi:aminopeptidase
MRQSIPQKTICVTFWRWLSNTPSTRSAIVVLDAQCDLAVALTEAYRRCLPEAVFIAFDSIAPEAVLAAFEQLAPGDLVVLIQSTSFRLDAFRIRVELLKRSLKVIEHLHLSRMQGV